MAKNLFQKIKKTNIPNSYFILIIVAVLSVAAVSYGVTISGQKQQVESEKDTTEERTESMMSRKVNDLALGMTREEVIRKMGLPDWAAVWGDDGPLAPPDEEIALELRWKNPECREVLVMFSPEHKVVGWDDGAHFCNADLSMEGREQYACTQPDRAQYCR